jgi:tRNA(Ile)-lysidine synthase
MLVNHPDADRWQLQVAHYNHRLRDDAISDQLLVGDLADIYQLNYHSGVADTPPASEAQARDLRYRFLKQRAAKAGADGIITAHHLDDRQETSIFNLMRGSGPRGVAPLRSLDGIHRPLINLRKAELIGYAKHHGLAWREDSTNRDVSIDRNAIRHELLPLARELLPSFDKIYLKALYSLDQLNVELDRQIDQILSSSQRDGQLRFSIDWLRQQGHVVLRDLVARSLNRLAPGLQLNRAIVDRLVLMIKNGQTGSIIRIGRIEARIDYNHFFLAKREGEVPSEILAQDLNFGTSVRFGEHQVSLGSNHESPRLHQVTIIPTELKVRRSLPGDRVSPIGMTGTKKLHDLFVDAKIDRVRRQSWPVVVSASDDQVVWVPRLALSSHYVTLSHPREYVLSYKELDR